jgi:predicted nuclease of predicted toxin-antitoxin system
VPIRILLDEHIKPEIAHQLTKLGHEVVCARDRGLANRKVADWELMRWCIANERAICTQNGPDFRREHEECRKRGQAHYGVLIVGRFWSTEQIYWALRQYLEAFPDPSLVMNQVIAVPEATADFIRERSVEQV